MTSVLNLDLGAGPELSLGGLALMRRPAQHRLGPLPAPGWAHPYTGIAGLAVFYNDGGQPGGQQPPAPAPSPADIAARAAQQPPAPAPAPILPPEQRAAADAREVLLDSHTGQPMTQGRFNQIMTKQFEKSRKSAYREMAELAGIPFDPDNFDPESFANILKDAQAARQAQMTEEQRRSEELARQQQALQADKARFEQQQAELAEQRRTLAREQALTRLGAVDVRDEQGNVTAPNLQDALAMLERDLRDNPDADPAALTAAADALKRRRPELFGATPAPQTLPPAPSGGPAGGNAPRPAPQKDAVKQAALERARQMGLRNDDAA